MGPKKAAHELQQHKKLLEGRTLAPESRFRGSDDKRGLHHPTNPAKYVAPTPAQEEEVKKKAEEKAKRMKNKPLTAVEQALREEVSEKRPPRIYRLPKEKKAALWEAQGKDPSKWQVTLNNGINFSMYPSHQPSSPESPSRKFLVGNKNNRPHDPQPDSPNGNGWTQGVSSSSFHHYEPLASSYTESLDGSIKRKSGFAVADTALAPARYNLQNLNRELTQRIQNVYTRQMGLCERITSEANKRSIDIYKKMLYKIRWCQPPVPPALQGLVNDYIMSLLGPPDAYGRRVKFRSEQLMRAGFHKHVATEGEKDYTEILALVNRIRHIVLHNDGQVQTLKSNLTDKQGKMIVKKSSTLRWKMESNVGRRDRFWTSWFFAMRGMPAELQRHLVARKKESLRLHLEQHGGGLAGEEGWKQKLDRDDAWQRGDTLNDVDERDPDFGMTALHYGSKQSNIDVVKILLAHGANPNMRAPDGRTALHFAAAYSTREICLELLGAEADIHAIDEYGCKAIHLAEQNENRATYATLEKWGHLVPQLLAGGATDFNANSAANSAYHGGDSIATNDHTDDNTVASSTDGLRETSYAEHGMPDYDIRTFMSIPDEYKPMDEERIGKMSRPLRAITYRLKVPIAIMKQINAENSMTFLTDDAAEDGFEDENAPEKRVVGEMGKLSGKKAGPGERDLDAMAELRLCSKVAEGCFEEGFVPEGIQALRRRWRLSKRLLAANSVAAASGSLDATRSGSNGMNNSAASALLSKHGFGRTLTPTAFTLHACVENGVQLAEALIRHGQEGFAATVLAETFLLTSNAPQSHQRHFDERNSGAGLSKKGNGTGNGEETYPNPFGSSVPLRDRVIDKYAGLWNNNDLRNASTDSVHNASINNSVGAQDNVTLHSVSITSQYLGREEEMKAEHVNMSLGNTARTGESAVYDYMEPSVAVALLARRCEVLLCVWDLLLRDRRETPRTAPFPLPMMPAPSMRPPALPPPQSNYNATGSQAASIDRILVPLSHENNNAYSHRKFGNSEAAAEGDVERNGQAPDGFYDGKGRRNPTRTVTGQPFSTEQIKAQINIEGSNYMTYAAGGSPAAPVRDSNQQAYDYSSTYKEYVGKYLEHQAQYVAELRNDLVEHHGPQYEPTISRPRSSEARNSNPAASAPTPAVLEFPDIHSRPNSSSSVHSLQQASSSVVEQDYNHRILVDNFGRQLRAQDPSADLFALGLAQPSEVEPAGVNSLDASVTFNASVAFDDGEVSAMKDVAGFGFDPEMDGSSAWYSPSFKLKPSHTYMDRFAAEHPLASPEQKSELNCSAASIASRPKTMQALQAQEDFISYGYDGEDYQLYQRILGVASECRICIENAINITLQTTSHLLVEPYVLVPLLEILAECYERENNYEDSLACLVRAETVTRRTLGSDTLEGIAILTNVLRMLIKCETKEGQMEAVLKAQELTRLVDKLSLRMDADDVAEKKARQREKDLGRNFLINPDGSIMLNPDRPSLKEQREEKMRRTMAGEDGSTVTDTPQAKVDIKVLLNAAVELVSLSKLLECGYEKMDTYDTDSDRTKFLKAREKPGHYSVHVSTSGVFKPNPRNKKVAEAQKEKKDDVERALLARHGKTGKGEKPKDYVVTGRMPPVPDLSQTLSVATGRDLKGYGDTDVDEEVDPELDGGLSRVFNSRGEPIQNKSKKHDRDQFSTKSAALAPHEHVQNVQEDIQKQKKRVQIDDGSFVLMAPKTGKKGGSVYDAKDNSKNDIAAEMATASINAGRYLQRKRYLKVNAVSILERRKVFREFEAPDIPEEEEEDVSSKYYRQLQHRALVLHFKHARPKPVLPYKTSPERSQSGSNAMNQSINNSINNSLLIQRNADGTHRMASAGLGASRLIDSDVVYDGSSHSNNPHTYNSVSIRTTQNFPDEIGRMPAPRVFSKSRNLGPDREEGLIANLELVFREDITAVQQAKGLETYEDLRHQEALELERTVHQDQEYQRSLKLTRNPTQSNTLPYKDGSPDGRKPQPWVLSPIAAATGLFSAGDAAPCFSNYMADTMLMSFGNDTERDVNIMNSPYAKDATSYRANATLEYESKYGSVAEARRAEKQEQARLREIKRLKEKFESEVEAKADKLAAQDDAERVARIHPLAATHRQLEEKFSDPKKVLQAQEKAIMRNMAGIQSLLKSHPGLEGLLPTQGVARPLSPVTNITTTSGLHAQAHKAAMLERNSYSDRRPLTPVKNAQSLSAHLTSLEIGKQLRADAMQYVGSIMTTGNSLVSIPNVERELDIDGDRRRAEALEDLLHTPQAEGKDGRVSSKQSSRPNSRLTKKDMKEKANNTSMLRFKNGEWKYQSHLSEEATMQELAETSLSEIQQSLEGIAEEKARNEPEKWYL